MSDSPMHGSVTVPARFLVEAEWKLKMSHGQFANLLGVSRRSIIRWESRGAQVLTGSMLKLAVALDAVSPELAAECRTLVSQDPTVPASDEIVDAILRAAALALGTSPEAVRPGVDAAFRAARSRGVSAQAVVLGLTPAVVPPPTNGG
jgi:hypothetical protein